MRPRREAIPLIFSDVIVTPRARKMRALVIVCIGMRKPLDKLTNCHNRNHAHTHTFYVCVCAFVCVISLSCMCA